MSRFRFLSFATCLFFLMVVGAIADEGMYPLYSIDQLNFDSLHARGLKLNAEDIYNPNGTGLAFAVVQLGATGEFVSPDGLMLTNHHVAYGAVQEQSTMEHNFLRDGFYAPTRDKELPATGYKVYVTVGIEEVTKKVLVGVKDKMPDLDRYAVIDRNIKKIVKQSETDSGIRARVASMFGGKQYYLFTQFEIRDVRMVCVPPEAIGKFGGEIDNWMWPRHTGDFSFMRAYVGPDGKPADYAKENVPYKPKVWLPVETKGVKEGDFTMTLGFPGSTQRYLSSHDLEYQINASFPLSIATSEDELQIMAEAGKRDSAIDLRLASDVAGVNNGLKKRQALMEGFKTANILERKRAEERELTAFLEKNPTLNKQYGNVLPELHRMLEDHEKTYAHDYYLGRMGWGCDYLLLSSMLYRWAIERQKPDMERERGYMQRDERYAVERLRNAQTNLVPEVDKEMLKYFFKKAIELPPDQRIKAIDDLVAEKDNKYQFIDQFVEDMYAKTKVGSTDDRLKMFAMSQAELEKLNDPFINLSKALYPEIDANRIRSREFDGALSRLNPKLVNAYSAFRGQAAFPDANGTMRLSYGEVKGYKPHDGMAYRYLTSLSGVIEKETGKDPFIVPAELKQTYEKKDFGQWVDANINDVPVDLLTTNDITNGNSGSPVINGEGKLIGCAFDGNWEGVSSDYMFAPDVTRTIAVDIRYVLFIIDKVYHFKELAKELGVNEAS